ncbi:hypothetical protein Aple_077200 [Acrocarpospora pleiomorpha]|uniref:Uncharacterized protein n=1 Tax=Acrocarpospora pleiomorpha TaxID=90975 RepID=A0A5M3XZ51_9ACTN|nr:hypothetical protein Aple_077200 [Acrocarpospora pleiomorpha]
MLRVVQRSVRASASRRRLDIARCHARRDAAALAHPHLDSRDTLVASHPRWFGLLVCAGAPFEVAPMARALEGFGHRFDLVLGVVPGAIADSDDIRAIDGEPG